MTHHSKKIDLALAVASAIVFSRFNIFILSANPKESKIASSIEPICTELLVIKFDSIHPNVLNENNNPPRKSAAELIKNKLQVYSQLGML